MEKGLSLPPGYLGSAEFGAPGLKERDGVKGSLEGFFEIVCETHDWCLFPTRRIQKAGDQLWSHTAVGSGERTIASSQLHYHLVVWQG